MICSLSTTCTGMQPARSGDWSKKYTGTVLTVQTAAPVINEPEVYCCSTALCALTAANLCNVTLGSLDQNEFIDLKM